MKRMMMGLVLLTALGGCASRIPPQIREAPANSPTEQVVRGHVQQFVGTPVRWGGSIGAVENRAAETWVEFVSRPLQGNGRPEEELDSSGRCLARDTGVLDPMIFTNGRLITVTGKVEGEEQRPIGKFVYSFPVVAIESYYLWPPLPPTPRYPPSYWNDTWWPGPSFSSPWYLRHRYPNKLGRFRHATLRKNDLAAGVYGSVGGLRLWPEVRRPQCEQGPHSPTGRGSDRCRARQARDLGRGGARHQ